MKKAASKVNGLVLTPCGSPLYCFTEQIDYVST